LIPAARFLVIGSGGRPGPECRLDSSSTIPILRRGARGWSRRSPRIRAASPFPLSIAPHKPGLLAAL